MRKQYHFQPSPNGFYAWDVDRLVMLTRHFQPFHIPLTDIRELDENFWYCALGDVPTCRSIVDHIRLIHEVDISYPIILSAEGGVMDGMHRVARSLLDGSQSVLAVQFDGTPDPDYVDVQPDDLPY